MWWCLGVWKFGIFFLCWNLYVVVLVKDHEVEVVGYDCDTDDNDDGGYKNGNANDWRTNSTLNISSFMQFILDINI